MDRAQSPTLWVAAFGAAVCLTTPCAALQIDESEPADRGARGLRPEIAPLWALHATALASTAPTHSPYDHALGAPAPVRGLLSGEQAAARAMSRFSDGQRKKKKAKERFKYADRDFEIFKYRREFKVGQREMVFKFKVPGKRKAWMRFKFEF